jgi:DNA ligase D-like protein (predicted ligase)
MHSIFDSLPREIAKALNRQTQPDWVSPMLATLTEERFSREGWIYEPKFDGERCLAFKHGSKINLLSRNQLSLNGSYPELAKACEQQKSNSYVIDGEVVAFKGKVTSFETLQGRMQTKNASENMVLEIPVYYYVFDFIYYDGYDLRNIPLHYRKDLLRQALDFNDPLRLTPRVAREGLDYYKQACRRGWEGVIAKREDSLYISRRSRDWLKFKCVSEQELVIGGYTEPGGARKGFGALLLGYYDKGELIYAGKVGTGFNEETLRTLGASLVSLKQEGSPFTKVIKGSGIHWVKPLLVGQVGFSEWTRYGMLRHPRFKGLRRDKVAQEVVKEV